MKKRVNQSSPATSLVQLSWCTNHDVGILPSLLGKGNILSVFACGGNNTISAKMLAVNIIIRNAKNTSQKLICNTSIGKKSVKKINTALNTKSFRYSIAGIEVTFHTSFFLSKK